jgi:hypothetical protein
VDGRASMTGGRSDPEARLLRLLAAADLETPAGRDRVLDEARPVIETGADRWRLVVILADALDVPLDYYIAPYRGGDLR